MLVPGAADSGWSLKIALLFKSASRLLVYPLICPLRFEGVQMETRDIDKAWLGRYLMDLRKIVVEDLVVVKVS